MAMEIAPVEADVSAQEHALACGYLAEVPYKRKRVEVGNEVASGGVEVIHRGAFAPSVPPPVPKTFLVLRPSQGVYHTEDFRDDQSLFIPLPEHENCAEFLVNVRSVEQISFCSGQFSIGSSMMRFVKRVDGKILDLCHILP